MVVMKKRLCIKCDKGQASFNFFGEKARFCSQCKEPDMINIMDKCKNKDCTNCGNVKYRYYCTHCFSNLFPNDPLVFQIRIKSKENYVRDFLNETDRDDIWEHLDNFKTRPTQHPNIKGYKIVAEELYRFITQYLPLQQFELFHSIHSHYY
jgi:hypothetical protein